MNTIRPGFAPAPQPTPAPRPEAGRLAAQKAFFALATGQAAPAIATAPPVAAAQPAPQRTRVPAAGAEAPTRVLRPGSLLDIRV